MHQQKLTGYILHARPYQEKKAIYQLFSQEYGLIHGVGKKGIPSFNLVQLFASGKNELKTFSQISLAQTDDLTGVQPLGLPMRGQTQLALLYMNEVLCRLLATENPCQKLWQAYHDTMQGLLSLGVIDYDNHQKQTAMRVFLRTFEMALFDELGVVIDFHADSDAQVIDVQAYYLFTPDSGFVRLHQLANPNQNMPNKLHFKGEVLMELGKVHENPQIFFRYLHEIGQIWRSMLDFLLEYRPLSSRKLWLEQHKYYLQP